MEQGKKDNLKDDIKSKTLQYIGAGLGLVAGLAWNDAIKSLIETVFVIDRNTVLVKFIYALIITAVVVLMMRSAAKFLSGQKKDS